MTIAELAKLLTLPQLYVQASLQAAKLPDGMDLEADDASQAVLLLAQVLSRLKFLGELQRLALIKRAAESILEWVPATGDPPAYAWILAFTDSRFVTWTGLTGVMHLETGELHDRLPVPPFESSAYNMAESWRRWQNRLRDRAHGVSADPETEHAGDV